VQLSQLRLVILSDLHRGARDGADDFQRCEPSYSAALGWYLERGYQLYLLGDVEELWENDIGEVLPRYADCAKLEKAFMDGPGLTRFFATTTSTARPRKVKNTRPAAAHRVLEALSGSSMPTRRSACSSGPRTPGTDLSDRGSGFSRLVLRLVWRRSVAWAGCRRRRPATTCAPSTTSRCSAGAAAPHSLLHRPARR
jgi:hypothetical protein